MTDDYRNALIDEIHTWKYDKLMNDDAKLSAWMTSWKNENGYVFPTEKDVALDELFGVNK